MKKFFARLLRAKWLSLLLVVSLVASNAVTAYLAFAGGMPSPSISQPVAESHRDPGYAAVDHRLSRIEDRLVHQPPPQAEHWAAQLATYIQAMLVVLGAIAVWLWVGRPVVSHSRSVRHPQPYDMA